MEARLRNGTRACDAFSQLLATGSYPLTSHELFILSQLIASVSFEMPQFPSHSIFTR